MTTPFTARLSAAEDKVSGGSHGNAERLFFVEATLSTTLRGY
jgi:hypothetical protein